MKWFGHYRETFTPPDALTRQWRDRCFNHSRASATPPPVSSCPASRTQPPSCSVWTHCTTSPVVPLHARTTPSPDLKSLKARSDCNSLHCLVAWTPSPPVLVNRSLTPPPQRGSAPPGSSGVSKGCWGRGRRCLRATRRTSSQSTTSSRGGVD